MSNDLGITRVRIAKVGGPPVTFGINDIVRHGFDGGRVGYIERFTCDGRNGQRWAWVRHKSDGTNDLVPVIVNMMVHECNVDAVEELRNRHDDDRGEEPQTFNSMEERGEHAYEGAYERRV